MSSLVKGQQAPNLFLMRSDGTSLELYDLWKKEHVILIFSPGGDRDTEALISRFQDQARLFEWLNARLLCVYPRREVVPTPWPAPGYPACLHAEPLPGGYEWGKAYVISKNRTLLARYDLDGEISVARFEEDLLYWEAGHCLPS
jgi:hypothetical protein